MQTENKHSEIRQHIAEGETQRAFSQFLELTKGNALADEAERLYARFTQNENELKKGIAASKEALPERDEIINDFINLLDKADAPLPVYLSFVKQPPLAADKV